MFCEAPIFKTVGKLPGKYPRLSAIFKCYRNSHKTSCLYRKRRLQIGSKILFTFLEFCLCFVTIYKDLDSSCYIPCLPPLYLTITKSGIIRQP